MQKQLHFTGTYTAIVTPFRDNKIDEAAFEKLVKAQVRGGVDGIVPVGTTGESPTLETQDNLNSSLQYKNTVNSSPLTTLREKNISPDFAGVRYQGQRRERDTLGEGHDTAYTDE